MSIFTVSGRFEGRDGWREFETELEATNEAVAEEHVYASFGSRHNLARRQIEIGEVRER
ncbi:50S ribosomal protein L18Ae [Natronorarus salvus]|uniref:50S ribosomal protein L18Ae n=1 Tax=Natronorarus salvus TaxID=3117733 RepID=UPI002F2681CB